MKTDGCMIHLYQVIALTTIAGKAKGYRCKSCGHIVDRDPRYTTHHIVAMTAETWAALEKV